MTDLDDVLRIVMHAAHHAALDGRARGDVAAASTRDAVRAAFECALTNGLIQLTPSDGWPTWVAVDPPYRVDAA